MAGGSVYFNFRHLVGDLFHELYCNGLAVQEKS